jgi:hypothetical protein
MGFSKLIITASPLIWGSCFCMLLTACNNSKNDFITKEKTDSICNFKLIDENSSIFVFGAEMISFNNVPYFSSFLRTQDTISLLNVNTGIVQKEIGLIEKACALATKDSSIYLFYENKNYYTRIDIKDSLSSTFNISEHKLSSIFTESFFISSSKTSNIHIIDSTHMLFPYKVENGIKNMIDTFAYIYVDNNDTSKAYKLLNYINPLEYDYLYRPVTAFHSSNQKLIYGFEKSNKISVADLINKTVKIIELDKFETTNYPKEKMRDLTFIRQYLKENDRLQKILIDSNSNLYFIVKYSESNTFKFRVYIYIEKLDKLFHKDISYPVFPNLAFIKNNSLYVPDSNSYSIFTYNNSMQ